MSDYLLPCVCGKTVPVDVGQAGERVTCSCGTQLDVPTLRQLRHLPRATPAAEPRPAATWGPRQGIATATSIIVVVLLGWSAWIWWNEPVMPKFDPAERQKVVEEQIKTPLGAWDAWIDYYRPLAERGFPIFRVANQADIQQRIAHARFLRRMLWAIAAVFGFVTLCAIFWPRPQPVRSTVRRTQAPQP